MNSMSISQYILARIYAKRMVQFLRARQRVKRQEKERVDAIKMRRANNRIGVQTIQGVNPQQALSSFKLPSIDDALK